VNTRINPVIITKKTHKILYFNFWGINAKNRTVSVVVMYFIILATGTALFSKGITQMDTIELAAKALEPVAGKASYLLFAIGVIGTGFLAIPC
jgi:Mn2+/Fe2+ NRAMP family transporter